VSTAISLKWNLRIHLYVWHLHGDTLRRRGCAALLMAARPETPVASIIKALKETAKHPLGAERRPDNRWRHGLIQPAEALKALSKGLNKFA
jgi:serine protease AprX